MTLLLGILATVLGLGWAVVAAGNAQIVWRDIVKGEDDGRGLAPLIGGVLGMLAVLLAPVGALEDRLPFIAAPLLLDVGTVPFLTWVAMLVDRISLRLFASRAHVHARNRFGQTPLHVAASLNLAARCRQLLDQGADPHARDNRGMTPFDRANAVGNHDALAAIAGTASARVDSTELQHP